MNSIFRSSLLGCAAAALIVGLALPAHAADTIKIGAGGAHSGELASYGVPSLNAIRLVADEFNAKGGLLGKQVEIIAADDQCKPELAPNAATSMLSQGAVAIVGMICSGATKASLPIFNEANVVVISPSATTPALTLSGENKTFMRTIGHDFAQAEVATEFLGTQLKPKTIAMLHDNSEYGKGFVDSIRENVTKSYPDIEVVLFEAITPGAPDYSAVARKIKSQKAELVIWGGYHPEASKLLHNLRDMEIEVPLIGPDGLKDENYILTAGEVSEGTYASGPADTANNPLSKKASEDHMKKYGTAPGAFFDNAYAAAYALMSAIEKAGSTETDKIMDALHTNVVATPIGAIKFDAHGDAEGIGMTMYQVKDGKFVPVYSN